MIIPKALLAMCSTDCTRLALSYIYVDVEKKIAVATDGHKLAEIAIEPEEGEVSGHLPVEAVIEAHKLPKGRKGQLFRGPKTTDVRTKSGATISFSNPYPPEETPLKFPEYEHVFPAITTTSIAFDAQYLCDLAKVLDPKSQVILRFANSTNGEPIMVESVNNGKVGQRAVLMGCRHKA